MADNHRGCNLEPLGNQVHNVQADSLPQRFSASIAPFSRGAHLGVHQGARSPPRPCRWNYFSAEGQGKPIPESPCASLCRGGPDQLSGMRLNGKFCACWSVFRAGVAGALDMIVAMECAKVRGIQDYGHRSQYSSCKFKASSPTPVQGLSLIHI